MTIKQLIVGTLLGVSAVGLMIHRLPKASDSHSSNDSLASHSTSENDSSVSK